LFAFSFSEFPRPGDVKKHTLPILFDADAPVREVLEIADAPQKNVAEVQHKEFWMPDRFCKVCYGCEEAFTMYRRRHHCRMCGQIFCNACSSFYLEGSLFHTTGQVRGCKLCYDQLTSQKDQEPKLIKNKITQNASDSGNGESAEPLLRGGNKVSRDHNSGAPAIGGVRPVVAKDSYSSVLQARFAQFIN
jgi:hypothetical protein